MRRSPLQPDGQVVLERVERAGRDRDDALLVPLPPDRDPAPGEVEVADGERRQLVAAEPTPVPERDEGRVAPALLGHDGRLALPGRRRREARFDERAELAARERPARGRRRALALDRADGRRPVVVLGLHEPELPRLAEHAPERGERLVRRRVLVPLGERGPDRLRVPGPERPPGERLGVRGRVGVGGADRGDRPERAAHGPAAPRREPGEVDRGRVRTRAGGAAGDGRGRADGRRSGAGRGVGHCATAGGGVVAPAPPLGAGRATGRTSGRARAGRGTGRSSRVGRRRPRARTRARP